MKGAVGRAAGKLARAKRLWVLLWAGQTTLALLVALPLGALVARYLDHSLWAGELLRQFEFSVISEIHFEYGRGLTVSTVLSLLAAALAAVLLQVLVSGGVIAWLRQIDGRPAVRELLRAGAQWFWPMLRLTVWALIAYALILLFDAASFGRVARKLSEGMEERPVFILLHVRAAVAALLAALVNVMTDYARVRMLALERRSAWRALAWSGRFVFAHFGRVAVVWMAVAVCMVLFFAAKVALDWVIPAGNLGWILLGAAVQQAYVLSRIWTKLMFWATANEVYSDLNPPYRPPAPPREEPVEAEDLAR